ncbi:MAG: hypothetical protein KDA85_01810 [Planctomycetaceae bacterium]|nr:hypothetical protein [Planctomycetaceae bacterium]
MSAVYARRITFGLLVTAVAAAGFGRPILHPWLQAAEENAAGKPATVVSAPSEAQTGSADASGPVVVAAADEDNAIQKFMRQKLVASNNILEGLVTDELTMVVDGADTLLKMGREEKWRASNDMIYHRYSTEFAQAVKEMKDEAEAQSMDGTSLAWINVTMKCLKCHEWVRNTIIADKSADAGHLRRSEALVRVLTAQHTALTARESESGAETASRHQ